MMKNKKLFYGILVIVVLSITGISLFLSQKQRTSYIFDESKSCPDYGDCSDYGLESRKCGMVGDCIASCGYGCVSRRWMEGRIDCEAMWSNFECECINAICQRKLSSKCGIENCHGLDITCGSNVPEDCDMMYAFGDRCRQYASCEVIDGKCQLVKSEKFEECKACAEGCSEDFKDDIIKASQCESECVKYIPQNISQSVIDLCKKEGEFSESVRSSPECIGKDWKCVDGWIMIVYYDRRLTNATKLEPSLHKPKELINATIAEYSKSVCNCRTPISYHILIENKLEENTCENFYKFIEDYNSSCNDCVLTWETECC